MKCEYRDCQYETNRRCSFCEYHAPAENKRLSGDAFRDEIIRLFTDGHRNCDGFVFPCSFDLSPRPLDSTVSFVGTVFHGKFEFHGELSYGVSFERAQFLGGVDFSRARFTVDAQFRSAVFGLRADDTGGVQPCADFSSTVFGSKGSDTEADFANCSFSGSEASFVSAQFHGKRTAFSNAQFEVDVVSFEKACFVGWALDFCSAKFTGNLAVFAAREFGSHSTFFNKAVFDSAQTTFVGTVFSGKGVVHFTGCRFGDVAFHAVKVQEARIDFFGVKFVGEDTDFRDCTIAKGHADFRGTRFVGGRVLFNGARVIGAGCDFSGSQFDCRELSFSKAELAGDQVSFNHAVFKVPKADFSDSIFGASTNSFMSSEFAGELTSFNRASFGGLTVFAKNDISGSISFKNTKIGDNAFFRFADPTFLDIEDREHPVFIFFKRVRFNPLLTFFEGFQPGQSFQEKPIIERPTVVFRYCNLRETYFQEINMSMFSFHQSAFFEESLFTSSNWEEREASLLPRLKFTRHYLIVEELRLQEEIADSPATKYKAWTDHCFNGCDFPDRYEEIAEIYLRLKTAADRAKDYHMASWFYFNEFEMKRQCLTDKFSTESKRWKSFLRRLFSPSLVQYNLYRLFAGFGEKPSWSFAWFWIMTVFFTTVHLLNGIGIVQNGSTPDFFNYDVSPTWAGMKTLAQTEFWDHFGHSFVFTMQRVIPTSYLPGFKSSVVAPAGVWSFALSLMSSVTLILMVVFTAIGLKRHFRRF